MSAQYLRPLDSSGTIRTVGVLLLITLLVCPAVANAQLIARDDTHVKNASPTNFRDAERLIVGEFGRYTSFIRFDLSMLPMEVTGNEIQKATLKLFIGAVGRAGSFDVSRVQVDWNEATLSFQTAAGIVGNVEAIVAVDAEHANEYLLVDLTALVKEWVDGTQPNDGVALVPLGDVNVQFDSKEAKGTSHDPRLDIVLSPTGTPNGGVTSVTADSPLLVATATTTPHISLGIVPVALGGTGLSASGGAGSLLRSDGSAWTSAPLSAPDIPPGSAFYIRNATIPQPATSFNIGGTGTADVFNAALQFNIGGNRILSIAGTNNLFAGIGAGAGITTGSFNSFFGRSAGFSNTTGSGNSFFGQDAGLLNTTGQFNAFFGNSAGRSNTSASNSAFFGRSAGFSNTTGSQNSFFGPFAGFSNQTGDSNALFGMNAGSSNTTGSQNAFFGFQAGQLNTSGGGNTFIGTGADFNIPDATGINNTLVGFFARVASGVSRATAIGAQAEVTQSNSLVLGQAGASGPNVGIGTTAPQTKLHLVGGKLYVDANGQGVVLKAAGGACFELTVTNAGALTTTAVACP